MQDAHHPYHGSTFQKYDAYDDEPYEMVQEPYELGRYPTVDDLAGNHPDAPTERKKEPSSPTFSPNYQSTHNQPPSTITTTRMGTNQGSDLVKQMTQKIKKQAEQLHELGNYRLLCEKRILELGPGHPLPVQPSHLGIPLGGNNNQITELEDILREKEEEIIRLHSQIQNQGKQASARKTQGGSNTNLDSGRDALTPPQKFAGGEDVVSNYNILYGKYKALLSEKQALEESLRNETLSNEEQRTYVEILRQMLDEKFDSAGITKWISGLPERGKIDALMEIKSLNDKLNNQQNEMLFYKENLQARNNEIQKLHEEIHKLSIKTEELISENLRLSEINIKASQTIKTYESEIKNLEEEKSNLIDYAEEKASNAEKIEASYRELEKRMASLKIGNQGSAEKNPKADLQVNNLQKELKKLMDENVGLKDKVEELEQNLEELYGEKETLSQRQRQIEGRLETGEHEVKSSQAEIKKLRTENKELEKQKVNKERELEEIRRQLDDLVGEHTKLQSQYQKKDNEIHEKVYKLRHEYETEISNLDEKLKSYEDNEKNFNTIIEKNNLEITKVLKQLNTSKEQSKKLEMELQGLKNLNNSIKIENTELKDTLEKIEKERLEREEEGMLSSREFLTIKEDAERNFTQMTELTHLNSTLEKKLLEKEKETKEYENIINDSKKRGEKDRQQKLDEVKRLYDENSELRREIHSLKENMAKATTNLQLKEQEISLVKSHLDKKTQQVKQLIEENRIYKQKADDLDYVQDQLNTIRTEKDRNARELRDYEEKVENKTSSLKNTITKLEVTENELFNTISNLKDLQRERADLIAENTRLQKKIDDLNQEKEDIQVDKVEHEEKYQQVSRDYERAQKNLSRVNKDLEDLSGEYNKLNEEIETAREEEKSYRTVMNQVADISKSLLNKVKQYIKVYSEMLATSPDALIILGKRFRILLETFDTYQFVKEGKEGKLMLAKTSEYIKEVTDVLLEEVENLGRRVIDLKQDLVIGNQRVVMLERKCLNQSNDEAEAKQREVELRRELETLREEKLLIHKDKSSVYSREMKIEKENTEMKKENARLETELRDLRNNLKNLDSENSKLQTTITRKQEHQEIRVQDIAILEEKYKAIQREKKGYEDLLQRISNIFANPELQKLIMDIAKLQSEIDQVERNRYGWEIKLGEMETDYKLYIKKTPNLSPSKSSARRSEIENARTDLSNASSQLAILKKRKNILFEEMKSFEIYEKRRYETTIETEKSLVEAKKQLQDLKAQNNGLEKANVGLKDAVKTISKEKQILDQENVKLRYPSFAEHQSQDNTKTFNRYSQEDTLETYEARERDNSIRRSMRRDGLVTESQRVHTGLSDLEHEGWERPVERSYNDRPSVNRREAFEGLSEKKESPYSRRLETDHSQQIKLKDRLNQTKNALAGIRKSYREENF